jgi:hypothetical protein
LVTKLVQTHPRVQWLSMYVLMLPNETRLPCPCELQSQKNPSDITTTTTSLSSLMSSTQIVFKDTPEFMKLESAKEERLDGDWIVTAASGLRHVDFTLIVVDAARSSKDNCRQALSQLMIGAFLEGADRRRRS